MRTQAKARSVWLHASRSAIHKSHPSNPFSKFCAHVTHVTKVIRILISHFPEVTSVKEVQKSLQQLEHDHI